MVFLSMPLYSQNFRLNAGGAYTLFSNINNRQVSFYGYGVNYSYYFYKKAGFFVSYDHYLPVTYYGTVPTKILYSEKDLIPVYITGGANSLTFGLRMKIIDPATKKIELNTTLAFSSFNHKGSYYIEETLFNSIQNKVKSVYAGVEFILKKGNLPLAISGGYNFVLNQGKPVTDNWDFYSVPFSSHLVIKAGISLPVMKGPTPSQIKQIGF